MGMYDRDWYHEKHRRKPQPTEPAFKAGGKVPEGRTKDKNKPENSGLKIERIPRVKKARSEWKNASQEQHSDCYYNPKAFRGSKKAFLNAQHYQGDASRSPPPELPLKELFYFLAGIIAGCLAIMLVIIFQPSSLVGPLRLLDHIFRALGLSS